MEKKIKIGPDKCQYFMDMDSSILHWSVQVSRTLLSLDEAKKTLGTLYATRATRLDEELRQAGISAAQVASARIDPSTGEITVELKEHAPAAPEGQPNAS